MASQDEKREAIDALNTAILLATANKKFSGQIVDNECDLPGHAFSFDSDAPSEVANEARKRKAKAEKLEQKAERLKSENKIRARLGNAAIALVSGQLIVCDVAIIAYGVATVLSGGTVPAQVVIGWMTATLVEVIGILWVIARSLYPMHDDGPKKK